MKTRKRTGYMGNIPLLMKMLVVREKQGIYDFLIGVWLF